MKYYPVFLNLQGRLCVVIGGGTIAQDKVKALLEAEAQVTIVSPGLTPALQDLAWQGRIQHLARAYEPGDLAGAFIAISATDDSAINALVWHEAEERGIPVNVVDDLAHCNFIAPSIMRRGDLTIAVSTSGKAPAVAVRLRQQLEQMIGPEYERFLELAGTLRAPLAKRYPDFNDRKELWYRLVDSDVFDLLRAGDEQAARQRIAEIMGVAPTEQ